MKKTAASTQGTKFSEKDTDRLIAGYGRQLPPEKKAALLAKLEAERGAFEKTSKPAVRKQSEHERDRS